MSSIACLYYFFFRKKGKGVQIRILERFSFWKVFYLSFCFLHFSLPLCFSFVFFILSLLRKEFLPSSIVGDSCKIQPKSSEGNGISIFFFFVGLACVRSLVLNLRYKHVSIFISSFVSSMCPFYILCIMSLSTTYTSRIDAQKLHQLSTFISVKLNFDNYLIWKTQLKSITGGQGTESHIFDEPPHNPFDDDIINIHISPRKRMIVLLRVGFEGLS